MKMKDDCTLQSKPKKIREKRTVENKRKTVKGKRKQTRGGFRQLFNSVLSNSKDILEVKYENETERIQNDKNSYDLELSRLELLKPQFTSLKSEKLNSHIKPRSKQNSENLLEFQTTATHPFFLQQDTVFNFIRYLESNSSNPITSGYDYQNPQLYQQNL